MPSYNEYSIELIRTTINILITHNTTKKPRDLYEILKPMLVYCIRKVGDRYLLLNREYKPLGLERGAWADYEQYPFLTLSKEQINFSKIPYQGTHLFNDSTCPSHGKEMREKYINTLREVFILKKQDQEE